MDHEPRFKGIVSEERHKIMSRIRGKDTKPEIILRKYLWSKGLRYRKNYKVIPGRPDIAITKYKIAIFCDSEVFHGKDWDKLKQSVGDRDQAFVLTAGPSDMSSEGLAERIRELENRGIKTLHFFVPPSMEGQEPALDGYGDGQAERMSLSDFTMPSHMTGMILFEQIYRAYRILNNQPYHK